MCWKHLFETVSPKNANESKYIQLENIECDSIVYNVTRVYYIKKSEKLICPKQFKTITLSRDRILFDDDEHIKYEYIANFMSNKSTSIFINTFTNIDKVNKFLYVDDSISTIYIQFETRESIRFSNDLIFYLKNYKKYNSWDKKIKNFKVFKLCFR